MKERTTVITRKGQVTIPAEIRQALGLKEGDAVSWHQEGNGVRLAPARFTLESVFGSVKPKHNPEDFEELINAAKTDKARRTIEEVRGETPS